MGDLQRWMCIFPLQVHAITATVLGKGTIMASKSICAPIIRRTSVFDSRCLRLASRRYSHFAPARRRCVSEQRRLSVIPYNRCLSTTPRLRLASVEEREIDPWQLDRESDEVDVCIVGGGVGHDQMCMLRKMLTVF